MKQLLKFRVFTTANKQTKKKNKKPKVKRSV